jgi:hypothetical protein
MSKGTEFAIMIHSSWMNNDESDGWNKNNRCVCALEFNYKKKISNFSMILLHRKIQSASIVSHPSIHSSHPFISSIKSLPL